MIDGVSSRSLDDIRAAYKAFLRSQALSPHTIATSSTDAFYIWRKKGADIFWDVVLSDDWEAVGKATLLELLKQQSSGNTKTNVSAYMAHLRRFRRFLQSTTDIRTPTASAAGLSTSLDKNVKPSPMLTVPSVEQAEYYLAKWDSLEDYHLQEDALDRLFLTLCPENTNITDILLKASVLNDFYSTNIFKVYPVAKHILSLHIDERLQKGDVTLVDDVKTVSINGKTLCFYSFATKYCSHHKPLDYPIYDSYVDAVLRHYRKVDQFAVFQNSDLKSYASFKAILETFRAFYHLDRFNLKQLDQYLWQLGKAHFSMYE